MATANRRRIAAAGALAAAALAAPVIAVLGATATANAEGRCLAWFGSRGDGICLGYSNGSPTYIGTPDVGVYGPGYGLGITTGPLLPGQTFTKSVSP